MIDVNLMIEGQMGVTWPRWQRIALDAYYRAERRGFAPGGELDDWLAAEQQTD